MYTHINFKSKKDLKQAVADGKPVTYFQPGPFGCYVEGPHYLQSYKWYAESTVKWFIVEGPHYPQPHKWYATCTAINGVIVKVK